MLRRLVWIWQRMSSWPVWRIAPGGWIGDHKTLVAIANKHDACQLGAALAKGEACRCAWSHGPGRDPIKADWRAAVFQSDPLRVCRCQTGNAGKKNRPDGRSSENGA